jgi:hypothetical protein
LAVLIINEKTSMAGLQGGDDGGLGAPTINIKNIDGGPLGCSVRDLIALTINAKNVMAGPLGGADGDLGAPTINAKKHRRQTPWEAVPKIREYPPPTPKILMVGP